MRMVLKLYPLNGNIFIAIFKLILALIVTSLLVYLSFTLIQVQLFPTIYQSTPNQMNQEILAGKAPAGVTRVDVPRIPHEKPHVHLGDGSALNNDGTWKHGKTKLTNKQKKWLKKHGWRVPRE